MVNEQTVTRARDAAQPGHRSCHVLSWDQRWQEDVLLVQCSCGHALQVDGRYVANELRHARVATHAIVEEARLERNAARARLRERIAGWTKARTENEQPSAAAAAPACPRGLVIYCQGEED